MTGKAVRFAGAKVTYPGNPFQNSTNTCLEPQGQSQNYCPCPKEGKHFGDKSPTQGRQTSPFLFASYHAAKWLNILDVHWF